MKPLLFLHGWAQSQQIWCRQRAAFPDAQALNLPGHGGAPDVAADAWAETVARQLPDEPCVLVGWSLGGMLALDIARRWPDRIAALALVATTPRFRRAPDWPPGCEDDLFAGFEAAVADESMRLLSRFFSLMLHGDALERRARNELARAAVDRRRPASPAGLSAGLELLAEIDLREALPGISAPAVIMHGEQDAIVPFAAGRQLAGAMPQARIEHFADCGHAPFLTRPERFNTILHNWWSNL